MSEKKLSADDALKLAVSFRQTSIAVGDFLYSRWDDLDSANRAKLQGLEISLLNVASDLTTQAVDVMLADGKASLAALTQVTQQAHKALAKINDVKQAIGIVTALIGLAAAIPTGNPSSILSAYDNLDGAIKPAVPARKSAARKASVE